MKKIGVIVAQKIECENLFKKLGKSELIDLSAGFCVEKFVYAGKEIYFIESGVGEIRASIAVQKLIDYFKVDAVINFGVAGGIKKGTRGNVYVIKGVCHYDFDTTPADNMGRGRYECFPSAVIETDKDLCALAKSLSPSSDYAVCASGDKFIVDPDFKKGLFDEFSATVCEMEAAGVAITSKLNGVPCLILKIVSDDSADANEYFEFLKDMTDKLNDLIVKVLENI